MNQTAAALLSVAAIFASPAAGSDLPAVAAERKDETPVVKGTDGWLYLPAELRHLAAGKFWGDHAEAASRSPKPETADPLPAILDFKDQLDARGIRLVVVPVPAKAAIYPEPLSASAPAEGERPDAVHREFYDLLEKAGVEVVDLTPDFLAAARDGGAPVYCRTDSHWSGRGIAIAASKITDALGPEVAGDSAPRVETRTEERDVEISGDLASMLGEQPAPPESVALRFVSDASTGAPVEPSQESPILLLGDSHNLVFHAGDDMLASGAGLADQLAQELGTPVDLIAVRGSGATPARINLLRRARANPDYLDGKRAVVWCFSAREFTEADGWSNVPLPE